MRMPYFWRLGGLLLEVLPPLISRRKPWMLVPDLSCPLLPH